MIGNFDYTIVAYPTYPPNYKNYAKVLVWYMIHKTRWLWLVILIIPVYHNITTQLQKFFDFYFLWNMINKTYPPPTKIYAKVLVWYMIHKILWLWLVIMNIPLYHTVPTQLQKFMLESLYETWYIRDYGCGWWLWSYHCSWSYQPNFKSVC